LWQVTYISCDYVGWGKRAEDKNWGIWEKVFRSWKREQNKA
jgi:hypothetical protein